MNPELTQIETKAKAFKYDYERLQFLKHQFAELDEENHKCDKFEKVLFAELELHFKSESKTIREAEQKARTSIKYKEHLEKQIKARRNSLDIKALISGLEAKMEAEKMQRMETMAEMKYTKNN